MSCASSAQSLKGVWAGVPDLPGVKVHLVEGWVLVDGKVPHMFRDKRGNRYVQITANKDLKRKKQLWVLSKLIMMAVTGGSPSQNPRTMLVVHKDGNGWNFRPDNLEWMTRKEYMERKVMDNNMPLKLNGHIALTLKDVVTRLAKEGINDLDAIGSIFRVRGAWVNEVMLGKHWGYVDKYISGITTKASDYQIEKARERAALYADFDRGFDEHMAKAGNSA